MKRLSISKAWDQSRELIARDGRLYVAIAAAFVGLPAAVLILASPEGQGGDAAGLAAFFSMFLSLVAVISMSALALGTEKTPKAAIGEGIRLFPRVFAVFFMVLLPFIIGFVLLLQAGLDVMLEPDFDPLTDADQVPAGAVWGMLVPFALLIWVTTRMALTGPVAAGEKPGVMALLKRSWSITRRHFLRIFATVLLLQIAALLATQAAAIIAGLAGAIFSDPSQPFTVGALLVGLSVGLVATGFAVVQAVMLANIYAQLAAPVAQPSVPPVS